MKTNEQLRKSRDHSLLLPQKWLVCLLTLLATFVGSGRMWADEVNWTASNTTYTADQELSTNTEIVSVKLGKGTWEYNAGRGGITNKKQGAPTDTDESGACIVVTPTINITFSLGTYSSQSNCDLRMYESSNPSLVLMDFRQKAAVNNDFGVLTAGKTYYIYGVGFKTTGDLEYVFFKSFKATSSTCTSAYHTVYGESRPAADKPANANVGTGTDGFNTAFSQFYELESGFQYHYTFQIAGGDTSYKNWYLQASKSKVHNGDAGWDGQELLWVRQDRYGFFDGTNVHLYRNSMSEELNASNTNGIDDATFINDMKNATVDMTVSYADNKLFVFAKTTATSGNKYYLTGVKDADNSGNAIQLFFGVEASKITNLVAEKRAVYKESVHLESGQGTGRITIEEIDAPYYESDGFKISYIEAGTAIKIYATPKSGYKFVRIGSVYTNPREFTTVAKAEGDVFNLNFEIPADPADDQTIGTGDMSKAWYENAGDGAYSKTYTLLNYHEYTFTFDCARSTSNPGTNKAWNSWVITGSKTNRTDTKFILRPDSWVIDEDTNGDGNVDGADAGKANPAVATADGSPLDWNQFTNDLNGAHVTVRVSYDMNTHTVFVYEIIESSDRTRKYTYHYPYIDTAESLGDRIVLNVGVDRSQLTNFAASEKQGYKFTSSVLPANSGRIVMTNAEGTSILEGAIIGKGTPITLTAIANDGYAFTKWSSNETANVRVLNSGDYLSAGTFTHEIVANFESLDNYRTIWALTNYATTLPVYSAGGAEWNKSNNWMESRLKEGEEFTGAYRNADGTGELASFAGLLFNGKVAITNYNSDHVKLYANGGIMKVPVQAGQVLKFNAKTASGDRNLTVQNTNGATIICPITNGGDRTFYVTAADDGYITLSNNTNQEHQIRLLSVSYLNDFTFADGNRVATRSGSYGYVNEIVSVNENVSLVDAPYIWTSSDPSMVRVDANTGVVTVNESFTGEVTITATRQASAPHPSLAKSYVLEVGNYNVSFAKHEDTKTLNPNGTVIYWQKATVKDDNDVVRNDIDVVYKVLGTTSQEAIITQDETTGEYSLNVKGAGQTVVVASAGAITDRYTFNAEGVYFDNPAPVLRHDGSGNMPTTYQQPYTGSASNITWSFINDDNVGVTANINSSTGEITNISGAGILVVQASNGSDIVAQYCLTVPKQLDANGYASWDFYKETTEGTSPIQFGSLAHISSGQILGSAAQVKKIDGDLDPSKDPIHSSITDTYPKKNSLTDLTNNLKRRRTWLNLQADNKGSVNMYTTWNYTYKTFERVKVDNVYQAKYTNQELFSYGDIVNGDNGRIIKNTAGLIFDAQKDKFGVNDAQAADGTDHRDTGVSRTAKRDREQDRSVLMSAGASMTIPEVKKGSYIRLLWYRHAENAGDRFNVENAIDLDGKKINPSDNLRFTGSQYVNDYSGYTIFRVGDPDNDKPFYDVKITAAVNGWTEIYHIDITDNYETDFQICQVKVFRNAYDDYDKQYRDLTVNDNDHARDINEPNHYNADNGTNNNAYGWDLSDDWKYASRLTSRIQTNAKGGGLIKAAPEVSIMGHPGQNHGWSGWLNITLAAEEIEGTAQIDLETDNSKNRNNVANMIPNEQIRIGHDLDYTLPHLTGISGTGAIKLVFRTHSGTQHTEEPHYTLNKSEAWIAVGEYSVQDYPYTWDFTKYNMDRENKYENGYVTLNQFGAGRSEENKYGSYDANMAMQASETQTVAEGGNFIGGNPIKTGGVHNMQPRHKRFFAQTSQLTIGDNADRKYTVLETEGLRFRLNDGVKDAGDGDIKFVATEHVNTAPKNGMLDVNPDLHMLEGNAKHRKAWSGHADSWDDTKLNVTNTTITIPEVDEGMYVFVRSASKPANVTGAVDYTLGKDNLIGDVKGINYMADAFRTDYNSTQANVFMMPDQMLTNTYVYKVEAGKKRVDANGDIVADGGKLVADVAITFDAATDVEAIGVTNEFKMMTNGDGWATDSRASRIDYSETATFTKSNLQPYVITAAPRWDADDANKDCGWIATKKVSVIASQAETGSNNRGLILEDKALSGAEKAFTAERRLIPLFVPACNIPNDVISGNKIKDNIDENSEMPASNASTLRYVFTKAYYGSSYNGATVPTTAQKTIADDYSYYIIRQPGTLRANSSYLEVNNDKGSLTKMRQMFMYIGDEDVADDETSIESPIIEVAQPATGIYTLSGMKVEGIPTKKGIYIMNGKKVYVK